MYDDPKDMFQEMDALFTHIYTRMIRNFSEGNPNAYGYHMIIRQGGQPPAVPDSPSDRLRTHTEPVVEIHRIGDEVKVITELPGTTLDAIQLRIHGSTLTIDADGGPLQYHAQTDLPQVNSGSMKTSLKNGVLEITFRTLPDTSEEKSS